MKQYIRSNLGSSDYRYVFRSPILLTSDGGNTWFEPVYDRYGEFFSDIAYAMSGTNLAEYVDGELEGVVESITMRPVEVQGGDTLDLETTVICRRALTSLEISELELYLTGQFSDGWGEGFEQEPVAQYLSDFEDVWYDDGEEYVDVTEIQVHIHCHVWYYRPSGIQTRRWSIRLVAWSAD